MFFLHFLVLTLQVLSLSDNERLRQLFAEKANTVGPWIERQLEQVLAIGLGGRGSLESAVSQLKSIQQQVHISQKILENSY